MNTELDHDLSNDQWEALRALRPAAPAGKRNGHILQQLSALELVVLSEGAPMLTPKGRAVLLSCSPRMWELDA